MNSSTSTFEASENVNLIVFISQFVSFGVCIYVQDFFDAVRLQTSNRKHLESIRRRLKAGSRLGWPNDL